MKDQDSLWGALKFSFWESESDEVHIALRAKKKGKGLVEALNACQRSRIFTW